MFKVQKNDGAFKELVEYAKKQNQPLQDVLLSDAHLDPVAAIFYKYMPKMVKFTMKLPKFTEFYKNNRETFVKSLVIE